MEESSSALPGPRATTLDTEKGFATPSQPAEGNSDSQSPTLLEKLALLTRLETRGIQRVRPDESTVTLSWRSYLQPFVLWVSINLAAVNITLGMLGPTVFGLGFTDASLCAVGGSAIGSAAVAYVATWGPRSGCRTMVS
jgi:hypothetical protein